MRHPLLDRLSEEFGYPQIGLEEHATFVGEDGVCVLFFAGDPRRYRETTDVAVVLPVLVNAFGGRLRPALVAEQAELELQRNYGFKTWPTLVFVRAGGYLGAISRMRDWSEYLEEIEALMHAEPREPPRREAVTVPLRGPTGGRPGRAS